MADLRNTALGRQLWGLLGCLDDYRQDPESWRLPLLDSAAERLAEALARKLSAKLENDDHAQEDSTHD